MTLAYIRSDGARMVEIAPYIYLPSSSVRRDRKLGRSPYRPGVWTESRVTTSRSEGRTRSAR
jgi:hypothetical protein